MTRPTRYLMRMLVFLALVGAGASVLGEALLHAFAANPLLNGFILGVLVIGILWNLRQVLALGPEVSWLLTFQANPNRLAGQRAPRLLAPMASMLAAREARTRESGAREGETRRVSLSPVAMRSLLDGIASRLDEARELSRYMTGLLIFLGLLGTFWGLLETIGAVADVIGGITVGSGDVAVLFEQLKSGLAKPLRGMSTAFSASLFGLSGALILGFLDLTAGQAQNRFFNGLEEWLASLTRLGSGALGDGDASVPVYVQALLEQTAENMENLQHILARGEAGREQSNQAVLGLTANLATLADTMRANHALMLRVAETQAQLAPVLQRLSEVPADSAERQHLRNIEALLQRLITEGEHGRAQSTAELRNDLRILTRAVAALAEGPPR